MPVACAPAAGGNAGPASAATSTATTRRIVVSFPRFGVSVRQGTQPNAHRSPPVKRRGPPTVWTGREATAESEPDAARQDHLVRVPDHPAEFGEWCKAAI